MFRKMWTAAALFAFIGFAGNANADDDVLINNGSVGGLTFGGGAFVSNASSYFGFGGIVDVIVWAEELLSDDDEEIVLADAGLDILINEDPSSGLSFDG